MAFRRAFTLIELLIASSILVLVVGGTLSAFVGVQRMTASALTEAELAIGMRELREKLLFHAAPAHDGNVWCGILSGAKSSGSVIENGPKIRMPIAWGFDTTTRKAVSQTIELVSDTSADGVRYFKNDGDRHDDGWATRWLDPGRLSWLPTADFLVDDDIEERKVFYVNLESEVNGVKRRERVTVPVFGMAQRTLTGKVFDDE